MKPKSLIRTTEEFRAIEAGATEFRVVMKGIPDFIHCGIHIMDWALSSIYEKNGKFYLEVQTDVDDSSRTELIPPYQVGQRVYVREAWAKKEKPYWASIEFHNHHIKEHGEYFYKADGNELLFNTKFKSPATMPKWASRIWLEITGVRVERVKDITEEEALSMGFVGGRCDCVGIGPMGCTDCYNSGWIEPPSMEFMMFWNSKHLGSWERNDWVWVFNFRRGES